MRRAQPEYHLHCQIVAFLRLALDGNTFFFHPPNGGKRGLAEAKRFKAMGVAPGLPDIGIIDSGRILWLELKAGKGRLSPGQRECHELLARARCPVMVVRSLDDAIEALQRAGVPLRIAGELPARVVRQSIAVREVA
jgi:hypothetical protein